MIISDTVRSSAAGEDDLRGRLDHAVRTTHDDSRCSWNMVGEAVRATFAEIKFENAKSDLRRRRQRFPASLIPSSNFPEPTEWIYHNQQFHQSTIATSWHPKEKL